MISKVKIEPLSSQLAFYSRRKKEGCYFWISMGGLQTMVADWDSDFHTKANIVGEASAVMERYEGNFFLR